MSNTLKVDDIRRMIKRLKESKPRIFSYAIHPLVELDIQIDEIEELERQIYKDIQSENWGVDI